MGGIKQRWSHLFSYCCKERYDFVFHRFERRLPLTVGPSNFSQLLLMMIGDLEMRNFFLGVFNFFFYLCNAITGTKSLQYCG